MSGKIKNYYADGNTAKGFWSFHKSNIEDMKRIFILKGSSTMVKSSIIKRIGMDWDEKGYDIELMHCSSYNNCVNGMIIPQLKFGIVDWIPLHTFDPKVPETIGEFIDLDNTCNSIMLQDDKNEIIDFDSKKQDMLEKAYMSFHDALNIHDEWEKIYIENMSFSKATEITQKLEEIIFADETTSKKSVVRDRFMGSATPSGPIDFINNLTEDISKRYFIKGRPGTGKSTLLKKLAKNAKDRGFDVEIYHCGFDPNSLDMVIFRELEIAIFDSTSPHEYFPVRHNDEIIDMYKEAVNPGTDEKYDLELQNIIQRYKHNIFLGTSFLKKAKTFNDKFEKFYIKTMDFKKIEEIRHDINLEILKLL